ncbi:Muscarinic acetylcholine receptor M5, partial [Antrostomus carolinensis]
FSNSTVGNSSSLNHKQLEGHSLWEVITIATVTAVVSLMTIVGNILVMISFKVNSQLKTVNNYYLLSLACADLIIGIFSMNLYTSYILIGHWSLGSLACDLWLALDYVASNASVMNLLVISFDRYFSITRPLTYRAKRTPKRAGIMIGLAWLISFVLWAPVILCWQYFVGERTVPPEECQIQFLYEPIITFGTAIAAFYIPVSVMTILYCRIYRETEKRTKDLAELQATVKASQAASTCNDWAKADQLTTCSSYASSEEEDKLAADSVFQVTYKSPSKEKGEEFNEDTDVVVKDQPEENDFENQKYFLSPAKGHVQQSKKCMAYKFRLVVKDDGTQEANNGCRKVKISPCSAALSKDPSIKSMDPNINNQITKRKRMVLIKERKAAQTLSAILLAFIITWTPYNIMVLISTFCSDCIPLTLWHLGYWLCYVNSTVNPICYALCNKTFRKTFKMLLFCQWK